MEDEFLTPDEFEPVEAPDHVLGVDESVDSTALSRGVRLARGTEYGFGSKAIASTIGALPDVIDTVGASLRINDRGSFTKGFYDVAAHSIGMPGLSQWYEGNKDAIEIGSGIGMVLASDYAAGRLLAPAGAAMNFLRGKPFVGAVAELEGNYQNALRMAQTVDTRLAAAGTTGVDAYSTPLTISRLGQPGLEVTGNQVRNAFRKAAVAKGLVRNVTTEAILGITANQSFLYDNDAATNMAFMVGGLGVGGLIDSALAGHLLKKSANSDRVMRAMAKAYDPFGTAESRIMSSLHADDVDLSGSFALQHSSGSATDMGTSFAISAAEGRNPESLAGGEKSRLFGRRQALGVNQTDEAINWFQKATVKGLGVSGTGFSLSQDGLGNAVKHMLYRDPLAFYGAEEFGARATAGELIDSIATRNADLDKRIGEIQKILDDGGVTVTRKRKVDGKMTQFEELRDFKPGEEDAFRDELMGSRERKNRVEMWAIDGELVGPATGRKLSDWVAPIIQADKHEEGLFTATMQSGNQMGLYKDGRLVLPKGKQLKNLQLFESLALHRLGNKAIDSILNTADAKFIVPAKPNWFQLDMADEIIKRGGDESKVVWPAGWNRDAARKESFLQKAKELGETGVLKTSDISAVNEARIKWNLPRLSSYESGLLMNGESPADVVLRGLADVKDPQTLSYQDLVKGVKDARNVAGLADESFDRSDELVGNGFKFMLDDKGKEMQPFVVFKRPTEKFTWTRDDLATRLATSKALFQQNLMDKEAGYLTSQVGQMVYNSPEFREVSQVSGLNDMQVQSTIPGLSGKAPQTTTASLLNDVTQREWRDRDNPVLLAASRLNDMVDRLTRSVMEREIKGNLGDVVERINGPRNSQSKLLVNQYLSFRNGWDFEMTGRGASRTVATQKAYPPQGKALTQFVLDSKSEANQMRWRKTFGTEMPEKAVLTAPNGTPVGVDDLGFEFLTRFSNLANGINKEKNTLLRAQGLSEIKTQPLYAPPPNTKGKYLAFVLDHNNRPVPNGAIVAATPEEFAKQRAWLEDTVKNPDSPLHKPGARLVEAEDIADFNSLWDEAQMNFMDPGTTAIQPGKKGAGTLLSGIVNPNAMEDALIWARDSYLKHAHDLKSGIFKDQLSAAKQMAAISKESKPMGRAGRDTETRSIYDFYQENLLGKSNLGSDASVIGRTFRSWESKINDLLAEKNPHPSRIVSAIDTWVRNWNPRAAGTDESKKAFDTLVEKMGQYSPFKSVSELVESQTKAGRPKELAEITGAMSRFEATTRLRMFEWAHGLMNLSGILNATPAVVRSFQPLPTETKEEFARRIGHMASMIQLKDGKKIGVLNMPKLIYTTMRDAWTKDAAKGLDWSYMKSMGYVSQEVAEFHRQFGAIDSKKTWEKFVFGEGGKTLGNSFTKKDSALDKAGKLVKRRGLIGWASALSDNSEDFSRTWAHLIGLKVADSLGIEGREAIHSFAHDVANKMIANYDPKNRPAIFQGAIGAPFGLFQSFIWNYYQRMFRYLETGQTRALATQMGMQAGLFGLGTVPGMQAVNAVWGMTHDDQSTPVDKFYEKFGEEAGDFLLGGAVSNFTKLANLLPGEQGVDGIALYSRGDANVRMPYFNLPPIFDSARRVWEASKEAISMFSGANPHMSPRQLAEIASNAITNRPIAGMIETAAGGIDTDWTGQVISQNLQYMDTFARMTGLRSLTQQKEIESFYARKGAQETQNALMEQLNLWSREAIRAGQVDKLPDFMSEYIKRGGDPAKFNAWMKRNYEAAMETRGERMLDDFSKSKTKVGQMNALLNMGVNLDNYNPDAFQTPPTGGDLAEYSQPLLEEPLM